MPYKISTAKRCLGAAGLLMVVLAAKPAPVRAQAQSEPSDSSNKKKKSNKGVTPAASAAANQTNFDPHAASLLFQRGLELEQVKNYTLAIPLFKEALSLDPGNDAPLLHVGLCYWQLDDYAKATTEISSYLGIALNNSKARESVTEALRRGELILNDFAKDAPQGHARQGRFYRVAQDPPKQDPTKAEPQAVAAKAPEVPAPAVGASAAPPLATTTPAAVPPADAEPAPEPARVVRPKASVVTITKPPTEAAAEANAVPAQPVSPTPAAVTILPMPPTPAAQPATPAPLIVLPAAAPADAPVADAPVQTGVLTQGDPPQPAAPPVPYMAPQIIVPRGSGEGAAGQNPAPAPASVEQKPAPSEDASYYFRLARVRAGEENFKDAIEPYSQALQLKPNYPAAFNGRGYAYLRLKDLAHAIADFTEAIRLDPNYQNAYENRAIARRRNGDRGGATEDEQMAAQIRVKHPR